MRSWMRRSTCCRASGEVDFSVRKLGVEYRRRPDDRAAPFRLEGRAVAADRRPGARHGRAAAAVRRLARRSAQCRRRLPGSRPPSSRASSTCISASTPRGPPIMLRARWSIARCGPPGSAMPRPPDLDLRSTPSSSVMRLAEAEGLLRPISDEDEAELLALDPLACPATLALIPAFKALDRDAAFDASVEAFIDGVSCRCKAPLPQRSPARGRRYRVRSPA